MPPAGEVRLVYARPAPDGDEPLVAIVRTEHEAQAIEAEVGRLHPAVRVMWETHVLNGHPAGAVHAVLLEAGDDPIGVAAFTSRADAEKAREHEARDGMSYVVASHPMGWRRSGWPFDPATPATPAG
ncbi:MAG: hypothetical protein ACRDQA_13300 [Nocardioidaceae bacterium]